jgi:hypothetical protein
MEAWEAWIEKQSTAVQGMITLAGLGGCFALKAIAHLVGLV